MIENTTLLAGSFGLAMYGKSHTGYFIKGRILHEILPILVPHSQHFVQLLEKLSSGNLNKLQYWSVVKKKMFFP